MPKPKIILITVMAIVVIGIGLAIYFTWPEAPEIKPVQLPLSPSQTGAGEVGEVMVENKETGEKTALVTPTMPPAIFSTAATVLEIKADRLIARGDGNSFADRTPRTIDAIFTDSTLTFEKDQNIYYTGKEGLKHFRVGMEVILDGAENIRGKTEFRVKTVNIL